MDHSDEETITRIARQEVPKTSKQLYATFNFDKQQRTKTTSQPRIS
jgi:hypothetical protein